MNLSGLESFDEVWCCDFEFQQSDGGRPSPFLMCAREIRTGGSFRLWMANLTGRSDPPLPISKNALFVAYFASAELGSFLSLGWPLPIRILDLYVEFKCLTSGLRLIRGAGLADALAWFGIDSMDATEKESMRQLAVRGGPCQQDGPESAEQQTFHLWAVGVAARIDKAGSGQRAGLRRLCPAGVRHRSGAIG